MSTIQDIVQWIVNAETKIQACEQENTELRAELEKERTRATDLQSQLIKARLIETE